MIGSEYSWLLSLTGAARGAVKVRLMRKGLPTLAVALFSLGCLLSRGPHPDTSTPTLPPASATLTLQQEQPSEWPRLLSLWFLVPTLLPRDR